MLSPEEVDHSAKPAGVWVCVDGGDGGGGEGEFFFSFPLASFCICSSLRNVFKLFFLVCFWRTGIIV